jgi:OOP family OmpA-OmpF porin
MDPEDHKGSKPNDGCPLNKTDSDGDGVTDDKDKCPNEQEDRDGFQDDDGCPDYDNDEDGIPDQYDKCPNEPEDKDGFEDQDGCPELDNDQDGVPDELDACPMEKGIPEERGCPAKDGDGDGVMDWQDNCPVEKGEPSNMGCPAAQKQLLRIQHGELQPIEGPTFEPGKAALPAKVLMLDQLATLLAAHPEIGHLTLVGQTDAKSYEDPAKKKLTQDRVDAMKAFLVKKGVAESRLITTTAGDVAPGKPAETFSYKFVTGP